METILVIGGGITGLSAVYELEKQFQASDKKARIILAEAENELGGKIRTRKVDGFLMETGADSIVARKMDGSLLEELDLENEVVYNNVGTSYLYVEGELKQIPPDAVFGIPASIESLATSPLVSAEGKVAALKDYYVHDRKFTKTDSIGVFLEYYLGKELVEKQIAPVLSGVYSGNLYDLTIERTLPYLLDYKEKYGSILKGIEVNKEKFLGNNQKKFLSFQEGMSTMIQTMADQLELTEIWLNRKAEAIEKLQTGYDVVFSNGEKIHAQHIVLSIPHNAAEQLFTDEKIRAGFSNIKMNSIISVYLGFSVSDELLPANGTGFITAGESDLVCGASTWTSRKWKHTSRHGNLLVRLFYKNNHPKFAEIQQMTEPELVQLALTDVEKSLQKKLTPVVHCVTKWLDAMPVYDVSHPETVRRIENQLNEKFGGIFLAGCSYYGAGIPDCIENGRQVARKIFQQLN